MWRCCKGCALAISVAETDCEVVTLGWSLQISNVLECCLGGEGNLTYFH